MIRLLGALLLISGSSGIGVMAALRLRDRVEDLSGLIYGLEGVKRGLLSRTEGLKAMLNDGADQTKGRVRLLFKSLREEMDRLEEGSFRQLWERALRSAPLRCSESDLADLMPLGGVLGSYDLDSQVEALDKAMGALNFRLAEAVERRQSLSRVYGTMGVSVGVLLAIMLI